jgi:hypothetical protein
MFIDLDGRVKEKEKEWISVNSNGSQSSR